MGRRKKGNIKKTHNDYWNNLSPLEDLLFKKKIWKLIHPTDVDPPLPMETEKWSKMVSILGELNTRKEGKRLIITVIKEEEIYQYIKNPKRKKFVLAKKRLDKRMRFRKL